LATSIIRAYSSRDKNLATEGVKLLMTNSVLFEVVDDLAKNLAMISRVRSSIESAIL
jgi:hypothetical protein